jgi:hypothetical protein
MFFKVTLGVWLISTLIFFYFFIFDSSKESDASRARGARDVPPDTEGREEHGAAQE